MKRTFMAVGLGLALALGSTGCITFLTQIKVHADGSGTMVQTMTMNPQQMKETMESMAKQMGGTATESKSGDTKSSAKEEKTPFKTDDLKAKAKDLGNGVTFVSAEQIDTKTSAGVRVTYAFKDINQLSVNPKPGAALGSEGAGASAKDALKFRFSKTPNGDSLLTVVFSKPEKTAEKKEEPAPAKPPASKEEEAQQMAMMKQMFKGMHIGMSVDVDGRVVKTNSPYVSGSTVTLMDIDFDPLLANPKSLKALSAKLDAAHGDDRKMAVALKEFPGIKVNLDPEIGIEFAAK